jgi:Putative Ig domain
MLRTNLGLSQGDRNLLRERILLLILVVSCSFAAIGCSMLAENSASTPPPTANAQTISFQTHLTEATIGEPYTAVLAVSGGQGPYQFAVSSGQLPPGLALNTHTGSISGTPSREGAFLFTMSVSGEASAKGARNYTLLVKGCSSCIQVQLTPANPAVMSGGEVQFSAIVTNTSNPAVTWSASAGHISSSGLFTAPANTSAKTITITAKSAVETSAEAATSVSVLSSGLMISTAALPAAVHGKSYSATLAAVGGQPPYNWSLSSGTLPGLSLSSTGGISGSASKAGSFPVIINVTDSASNSAQQNFTLDVSSSPSSSPPPSSGFNCGPPTYNCSRTDFKTVQVTTVPNIGNLAGVNQVVTDPDFNNPIVRVTDWNTDKSIPEEFRSYISASSGSADENLWNVDSTMFVIQSLGSAAYPYMFDPKNMQVSRMYIADNQASGGLKLPDAGAWSRVDPNVLYMAGGTSILKYDFTDRVHQPSPQVVYDFTSGSNCLPSGFSPTWKSKGGVSGGDTAFSMAYSNSGGQGTGIYVVAYKAGSGCVMLNTKTGKVTGDWGSTGTMSISDRWIIHNVKMSKDGNYVVIAPQSCLSGNCVKGPYFWEIGTTNVTACADGKHCGGHWTEGYSHWVNNDDIANQEMRPLAEVRDVLDLTKTLPHGVAAPLDEHLSWNNADPADGVPFLITTVSPTNPFPSAFYNEIIGVAADGSGTIWRFAHSFITTESPLFSTQNGIGSVSQDGRFFIFSSDWMGTLGSQSGNSSCKPKTNCRGDVFILQLN